MRWLNHAIQSTTWQAQIEWYVMALVAPYIPNFLEEAERQATELNVDAWKFYTGVFNMEGEYRWWMDDEELIYPFYEKIKSWGKNIVCAHKGLPFRPPRPGETDYTLTQGISKKPPKIIRT